MIIVSISFYLLQTTGIAPFFTFAQMANIVLLIINTLFTIIYSVFVYPTYKEHKLNTKDYQERTAPAAIELRSIEKARILKLENDCSEIKHNLNNLANQLSPVLKKLETEPDLTEVLKAIQELNKKL